MKCFSILFFLLISCGSKNKSTIGSQVSTTSTIPFVLKLDTYSKLEGRELNIFGSCKDAIKIQLEIEQLNIKRPVFCYEDKFSTEVNLPISLDGHELTYKIITDEKVVTKKVVINFDATKVLNDLEFNLQSDDLKVFSDADCSQKSSKKKGLANCIQSGDVTFLANSKKSAPKYLDGVLYFNESLLVNRQDLINGLDSFEVILVVKADKIVTDAGILDVHRFERDDDVFSLRYDQIGELSFCSECVKGAITTAKDTYSSESGSFTQDTKVSMIGMGWTSGNTLKLYYNGEESLATHPKIIRGKIQAPETLYLGHGPKGSWTGKIYEFYLFKKQLSPQQRSFLYNRLEKKYLTNVF